MSLSDRYNRGEGRIQAFDRYLTVLGDHCGNYWWDRTGIPRTVLTQSLYIVSAISATQYFVLAGDAVVLVFATAAMMCFLGTVQSKGGVVEQIQSEVAGLPKNAIAFMRLLVIGLGFFNLLTGAGEVLARLTTQEPLHTEIRPHLLLGVTLTALQAGEYIRRTNPATPGGGGRGGLVRPSRYGSAR